MHTAEHRSFEEPEEVSDFPNWRTEIVKTRDGEICRWVLRPEWRWSNHVKPIANTDSGEAPHFQHHVSGQLAICMDGEKFIAGPGDVTSLSNGHDAWVIGTEPAVVVDWFEASNSAK
jgi:hypothetical protein